MAFGRPPNLPFLRDEAAFRFDLILPSATAAGFFGAALLEIMFANNLKVLMVERLIFPQWRQEHVRRWC